MAEVREKTPAEKAEAAKVNADVDAAKASGVEMIGLVVDGVAVEVPKGTLVIEAAFRAGADIPYFCYHPRLTSVGACRMCLASVELEMFGQRRASIMATCTIPCSAGMVVKTNTPDVKKAQNGVLEFLLANHPLDCPICDRGGECPLQNMTIAYGPPTSRFVEEKRHFVKAQPISDFVILDRERCIQCMRCTRFTEEIAGDGELSLQNRGAKTQIGPFLGADFNSNFSGNTIEICPVGALTSRAYRFKGRPWEVKSVDSICGNCGNGCNIAVQHRLGDLVRVNARVNEEINEEWTCDRGKFGQEYVNSDDRLTTPLIRDTYGNLVPASWDAALSAIVENLGHFTSRFGAHSVAGIGSTRATVEENYLLAKWLKSMVGTPHVDHRMFPHEFVPMKSTIASLENQKTIVSFGMDLKLDQPIVYLRVYKATRKSGAKWIDAPNLISAIVAIESAGGGVLLLPETLSVSEVNEARRRCEAAGGVCDVLLSNCNSWGAALSGAVPDAFPGLSSGDDARAHVEAIWGKSVSDVSGKDTGGILAGAISGEIRALFVMGSDPAENFHDRELAARALEAVPFLVVSELKLTETARRASVVLPASSFAEKDGTFVNIEGRAQKIKQAIAPRGESRPDWRILSELIARMGAPAPYFSPRDIYREYQRATFVGKD